MAKTERTTLPKHHLAPEVLSKSVTVVVGNAGSGKSSAARSAHVEAVLEANRRACIIDPTGVWWGLRFTADGKPGFKIAIVGGLYGDCKLAADDGERLAKWIAENDTPVIVDVSEMTVGERNEFATDFFAALYRYNRRPLHLIVDEADEFAPQNPMPETRRMFGHFDRIVRRGRVRGFRVLMVTQRPAVLHKNVLSQATVLIAMRMLGSQDRDAVQLWIKGRGDLKTGKEVLDTLSTLRTGEGWVWAPGEGILQRGLFIMFKTFDSSRTPDDDETAVEPPGPFPYEFTDLVQAFAHNEVDQAPADLQSGSTSCSSGYPSSVDDGTVYMSKEIVAQMEQNAHDAGKEEGLKIGQGYAEIARRFQTEYASALKAMNEAIEAWQFAINGAQMQFSSSLEDLLKAQPPQEVIVKRRLIASLPEAPQTHSPASISNAVARVAVNLSNSSAAASLLGALTRYRRHHITWAQACTAAGLQPGNGHFYRGKKYLLAEGLVVEDHGTVQITAAGVRMAGDGAPLTLQQIVDLWADRVRSPGDDILRFLAQKSIFKAVSTNDLGVAVKLKPGNGHWYRGIKALRNAGLIETEGGMVRLSTFVIDTARGIYR